MYQPKIEAMPRELKDALLGMGDFETVEDIMSLEDVNSSRSKRKITQISESVSSIALPDFWLVTLKDDFTCSLLFLVFRTKLSHEEEIKLFSALPTEIIEQSIAEESLSEEYSIY